MVRRVGTRTFPVVAWAYLIALGVQIFFAGVYVFAGPQHLELHRNFAHIVGITALLLVVTAYVGRIARRERRLVWASVGLLIAQGMLVHVHQSFGAPLIAALHPVNASVMVWAALVVARRASAYWSADPASAPNARSVEPAPATA